MTVACAACAAFPVTLEELVGWRHAHGAVCWWLVREIYQRHLGLTLPVGHVLEARDRWGVLIDEHLGTWEALPRPMRYAGVLARPPAAMPHVHDHMGVALDADAFVHFQNAAAGVVIGRVERYRAAGWTVQAYRYRGRA